MFVLEGAYDERDRSKRTLERDVSSPLEARVAIPEDEHERARQDEVRGGRDREEGCIHPLASRDQHAREGARTSPRTTKALTMWPLRPSNVSLPKLMTPEPKTDVLSGRQSAVRAGLPTLPRWQLCGHRCRR